MHYTRNRRLNLSHLGIILLVFFSGVTSALSKALRLEVKPVSTMIDGIAANWIDLTAPDYHFEWWPSSSSWLLSDRPLPQDVSLELNNRYVSGLKLQLVLLPSSHEDYTPEFLEGYFNSLKARYPGYAIQFESEKGIDRPENSARFLTRNYRVAHYDLISNDPEKRPSLSVSEAITLTKNGSVFVYRLIGPMGSDFEAFRSVFNSRLSDFEEVSG